MDEVDPFDEIFAMEDDVPLADPTPEPEPELPPDPEPEPEPEPAAQPEPAPEPEPNYKELYEREQQRLRSAEGRFRKEKEDWERARSAPQPQPAQPAEPDPEDTFISKFRETYNDDVVRAIEVLSERKARSLMGQVQQESIAPLQQTFFDMARENHFRTIQSAHSDWEDVVQSDGLREWVGQQPGFVAKAYQDVLQRGSAQDVVDLLSTYKESIRPAPPAPRSPVNPAKAAAATVVRTAKGSVPKGHISADDFDAAWAEAPD